MAGPVGVIVEQGGVAEIKLRSYVAGLGLGSAFHSCTNLEGRFGNASEVLSMRPVKDILVTFGDRSRSAFEVTLLPIGHYRVTAR